VTAQLRSELLKQRTTRTILLLPLWMTGLIALVVLLHVFSLDIATLSQRDGQLKSSAGAPASAPCSPACSAQRRSPPSSATERSAPRCSPPPTAPG
jgi:hypothetical protein